MVDPITELYEIAQKTKTALLGWMRSGAPRNDANKALRQRTNAVLRRSSSLAVSLAFKKQEALKDSLREMRNLAMVSHDGDPYYAEHAGLDVDGILTRAREALGEKLCLICGRKLDVPGDPASVDCGGDCRACMNEIEQ